MEAAPSETPAPAPVSLGPYRIQSRSWSRDGITAFDGETVQGAPVSGLYFEHTARQPERTWPSRVRTARVVGRLGCEFLPDFHGHAEAVNGAAVLATSRVPGETVEARCREGIDPGRLLSIARQVCKALDRVHGAGLCHGALSAASIRIGERDGRGDAVVVVDFGVASDTGSPSDDLERFGRIFLECVGRPIGPIADGMVDAFERCIVDDPSRRWPGFAHVEDALCDIAEAHDITGPWSDLPPPKFEATIETRLAMGDGTLAGTVQPVPPIRRFGAGLAGLIAIAGGLGALAIPDPARDSPATVVARPESSPGPLVGPTGRRTSAAARPPTPDPGTGPAVANQGSGTGATEEVTEIDVSGGTTGAAASPSAEEPATTVPSAEKTSPRRGESNGAGKEAARLVAEARRAMAKGKRAEATALFHQALSHRSKHPGALIGLSDIYFDRGAYAKAVQFAKAAVGAAPRNASYRIRLGDAYQKILEYDDARAQYDKAASLGDARGKRRLQKLDAKLGR